MEVFFSVVLRPDLGISKGVGFHSLHGFCESLTSPHNKCYLLTWGWNSRVEWIHFLYSYDPWCWKLEYPSCDIWIRFLNPCIFIDFVIWPDLNTSKGVGFHSWGDLCEFLMSPYNMRFANVVAKILTWYILGGVGTLLVIFWPLVLNVRHWLLSTQTQIWDIFLNLWISSHYSFIILSFRE